MKFFIRACAIWLGFTGALLSIPLVLFYGIEDYRGAHAWAKCRSELAAKGEILDLRKLVPPGRPEDDLSKTAIFAPLFEDASSREAPIKQMNSDLSAPFSATFPSSGNFLRGKLVDLAEWQKFYRTLPNAHLAVTIATPAQDVLQVLSRFDPQVTEIDQAVSNPAAHWPIDYDRPFDTNLGGVTKAIALAKILQLQGAAHLQNGEADLAKKDYLFSLRLNHPFFNQCNLVEMLIAHGVCAIDYSILYEGIARHAWNDVQLREMEAALGSQDFMVLATACFRGERASALATSVYIEENHVKIPYVDDSPGPIPIPFNLLFRLRPRGWGDQDRSTYSLGIQELIDSIDLSHGALRPPAVRKKEENPVAKITQILMNPLTTVALPAVSYGIGKTARAETYQRLARLACRLEEYRLAHGQYPEVIADLPDLPPHLNQEILSENPLQYRRKGEGYLLYSVGWNQKDEGGLVTGDPMNGDWVWPSPVVTSPQK